MKMPFYYFIIPIDNIVQVQISKKFKGPRKSFGYWGLKLLPGIRVIAEGLDLRPRPEPYSFRINPFKSKIMDLEN